MKKIKYFMEMRDVSHEKSVYMGERQMRRRKLFSDRLPLLNKEEQNDEYPERIT